MKASKNNYPNFYLLPLQVVSSLIEVGNTFLEENKKMTEEMFSTGSQKQTKSRTIRNEKKKSPSKLNAKTVREKKLIPKKNLEKKMGEKVNSPAINRSSSVVKKKVASPAANKAKNIVKNKIVSSAKGATKSVAKKKVKAPTKNKTKSSVKEIKQEIPKVETHGEDMHFIHEKGENHQRTILENHHAENIFHQQADVALHQEKKKVMDARPSNKIFKRFNRSKGQR